MASVKALVDIGIEWAAGDVRTVDDNHASQLVALGWATTDLEPEKPAKPARTTKTKE